jgi:2-C-methyl-D-erythritol 4-phosphate cytidylyltransferase
MNVAVIVAAGSGVRFGGDVPKILLELKGVPVIIHSIRRFAECADIDSIVVVVSREHIETVRGMISREGLGKPVAVVEGGETRNASVRSGIKSLDPSDTKLVVIHDGARPLVRTEDIESTIRAASVTGAAVLAVQVTDTVKEVRDGKVVRTVDRRILRRAVTPQVFNIEILLAAIASGPDGDSVTDESLLVEMSGFEVAVVEGDSSNLKITHPSDMTIAEALIEKEPKG